MDKAVWFFPIPGSLENTKIDISSGVSFEPKTKFSMKKFAQLTLIEHLKWISATQIYPILFFDYKDMSWYIDDLVELDEQLRELERLKKSAILNKSEKYFVHQTVNKFGLTSELISLEKLSGLYKYINSKNIKLPESFIKIAEEYIGNNYLFVVSWFNDSDDYKFQKNKIKSIENVLEVNVNFKTPKIFFPLKVTSLYGDTTIPVNILINSHVNPYLYNEIISDTYKGKKIPQVSYFIENKYINSDFIFDNYKSLIPKYCEFIFKKLSDDTFWDSNKFTQIYIDVPAKNYVKDLWISPWPPLNLLFTHMMFNYSFYYFLLYFLFLSCISSLIAGKLCFNKFNPHKWSFFLFGLFNILSIIGILVFSFILRVNKRFVDSNVQSTSINLLENIIFVIAFTSIFIGLHLSIFSIKILLL